MATTKTTNSLLLNGLQGGNLLAFLASVGVLRTLAVTEPEKQWKLSWEKNGAGWSPVLYGMGVANPEELIEILHPALQKMHKCALMQDQLELQEHKDTAKIPCHNFRKIAMEAQNNSLFSDRTYADFIAALGSECIPESKKDNSIQDTALRTMSGAGHQHFLETMRLLIKKTDKNHLRSALFKTWAYSDEKLGLRWDPQEDRRYALRWKDPKNSSKDNQIKTMYGANRLAVEALSLFPAMACGEHLETTGFSKIKRRDFFSWPIWSAPVDVYSMMSLLALDNLQDSGWSGVKLYKRGVVEVYRSERITKDKYRNFTVAVSALNN